jgi:hypothetical protein
MAGVYGSTTGRRAIASVSAVSTEPRDAHEWVSFEDDKEDRTWRFDLTFLESNWQCIFNRGCQGVLTGPTPELAQGCCSYGAHLIDKEDVKRVKEKARLLTDEEWQFKGVAPKSIVEKSEDGDMVTVLHEDACIFLNRPGFAAGPGCAFHLAAANHGESYVGWKPEVCWQLPLRREDDVDANEHVVTSIGQWDRRHWGEGGLEFHWWCTEAPEAFTGSSRVVDSMKDELIAMIGKRNYAKLLAYLEARGERLKTGVALAHPTLRTRKGSAKG